MLRAAVKEYSLRSDGVTLAIIVGIQIQNSYP